MVVGTIEISLRLDDDGAQTVWFSAEDSGGDPLPLITVLGMLEMSKDTAIRDSMGEADDA